MTSKRLVERPTAGLLLPLACALLMLSLSACEHSTGGGDAAGATEPRHDDTMVLGSFEGATFTEADLQSELSRLNRRARQALEDPDRLRQFVENHLMARLLYQEGERLGYQKDPEIERQIADLQRRLVIQKVMQEHQSAPVDDAEIREYYDAHPEEFATDRVHAAHILVKDEALAKEIQAKAMEDPERFAELAAEHSIDQSNAKKGGDLGFFGRGRMVKEFENAAFGLESDGAISDVVRTRFGYHIIKRIERQDGDLKPFDEVKNQIRIRLINDKRRAQTDSFLSDLKGRSGFRIDQEALAGVDLAVPEDVKGEQTGGDGRR